jgi:hypothetical protein
MSDLFVTGDLGRDNATLCQLMPPLSANRGRPDSTSVMTVVVHCAQTICTVDAIMSLRRAGLRDGLPCWAPGRIRDPCTGPSNLFTTTNNIFVGLGIKNLGQVEPVHVAAFVEAQLKAHSRPTVKQRLAALRMLFDWMVVGQATRQILRMPCVDSNIPSSAARRRYCRPSPLIVSPERQ